MDSLVTTKQLRHYGRIDNTGDEELDLLEDNLIQLFIDNAVIFVKDACGEVKSQDPNIQKRINNKIQLLTLIIAMDFYENREFSSKVSDKVKHTVSSMLAQLEYGYGD